MKQALLWLARAVGLFRLSRWLTRDRLRILCYHGAWLGGEQPNPFNFLYMQPKRFAHRLQLIEKLGLPVLPLGLALERMRGHGLPPCAVAITIDDGWFGTYKHMVPLLASRGWPATLYLTTHHVAHETPVFGVAMQHVLLAAPQRRLAAKILPGHGDDRRAFDLDVAPQRTTALELLDECAQALPDAALREDLLWKIADELGYDWKRARDERWFHLINPDEARDSVRQGIDLQLHTHRHRLLRHGQSCIGQELADNRAWLQTMGSCSTQHFCYPSGRWQPTDFEALRQAGVVSATTTDNGLCVASSELLALPRILDGDRLSDIELEAELCGLIDLKRQLASRLNRKHSQTF